MDLTLVAVWRFVIISWGHQEHPLAKLSDAEVMTTALVAARYFRGNQQTACAETLKTLGYIPNMLGHSRYNGDFIRSLRSFKRALNTSQRSEKQITQIRFIIDTYPVAVCDNIRISRSRLYQGEAWRGKIPSKPRDFYGIKAHLIVTEAGHIVEVFFTPGGTHDMRGLRVSVRSTPRISRPRRQGVR